MCDDFSVTEVKRAVELAQKGQFSSAEAVFRELLAESGDCGAAWNGLGVVLQRQGRAGEALAAYQRAVDTGYGAAFGNLGAALIQLGRVDDAVAALRSAVLRFPGLADAHYNLGMALFEAGRLGEAVAAYRQALVSKPGWPLALNNLGIALREGGDPVAAAAAYTEALEANPGDAAVRYNRALALLQAGDFANGWLDHEARFAAGITPPRFAGIPVWQGEDLGGRTLLVWAEQGFGDSLNFARYVPRLRARVVFEVQKPLVRLFQGLAGQVVAQGGPLPAFDLHIPLMSLPRLFPGTPWDGPLAEVTSCLAPASTLRVGLVWSGNPNQKNNHNRSIPFGRLAPLFAVPGVEFHSLQVGGEPMGAGAPLVRHDLGDFLDTARVMAGLDLVISVDTSVAHLAGALGRPVWLLACFAPDWRYIAGRDDVPWYPSMRLFRQAAPGEWEPVVERVRSELESLARSPPTGRLA